MSDQTLPNMTVPTSTYHSSRSMCVEHHQTKIKKNKSRSGKNKKQKLGLNLISKTMSQQNTNSESVWTSCVAFSWISNLSMSAIWASVVALLFLFSGAPQGTHITLHCKMLCQLVRNFPRFPKHEICSAAAKRSKRQREGRRRIRKPHIDGTEDEGRVVIFMKSTRYEKTAARFGPDNVATLAPTGTMCEGTRSRSREHFRDEDTLHTKTTKTEEPQKSLRCSNQ